MNETIFGQRPTNPPSWFADRVMHRWVEEANRWHVVVIFADQTFVTFWRDTPEEVHELIDAIRDDNAHAFNPAA